MTDATTHGAGSPRSSSGRGRHRREPAPGSPATDGAGDVTGDVTGPDAGAPPSWRIDAIEALGLDGDGRRAAASPSPAFPAMLSFIVPWVARAQPRRIVEIGAGLGGITDAVRSSTGLPALALDHSVEACAGARRLFPALTTAASRASSLPLATGSVGAAVLSGVLSRAADISELLVEAHRVLSDDGHLVIVDLVSCDDHDRGVGADVYRSIESIEAALPEPLRVVDRAVGDPWSGEWGLLAAPVVRKMALDRRGEPGFERWREHLRHLDRVLTSGEVLVAGIIAAS